MKHKFSYIILDIANLEKMRNFEKQNVKDYISSLDKDEFPLQKKIKIFSWFNNNNIIKVKVIIPLKIHLLN